MSFEGQAYTIVQAQCSMALTGGVGALQLCWHDARLQHEKMLGNAHVKAPSAPPCSVHLWIAVRSAWCCFMPTSSCLQLLPSWPHQLLQGC